MTAPRIGRAPRHNLPDIIALTLDAVICGADHGVGIAELPKPRPPGYSKSLAMLVDSLALVWLKSGWIQNACPCQECQTFQYPDC